MLEIFRPNIRARWNAQNGKLKNDLMNHMVNLFGDTFNKKGVTATAGLNFKYVTEDYRNSLQINTKYEHPSMVPEKELKALRKQGKTQPISSRRYVTYHIFNEKCSIFFFTFKYI